MRVLVNRTLTSAPPPQMPPVRAKDAPSALPHTYYRSKYQTIRPLARFRIEGRQILVQPFFFGFSAAQSASLIIWPRKLNCPAPCSHSPPSMVTTSPLM